MTAGPPPKPPFSLALRAGLLALLVIAIVGIISVFIERVPPFRTGWTLAFLSNRSGNSDIHLYQRGRVQNLTNNLAYDSEPVWSPDGNLLAYVSYSHTLSRDGTVEQRNRDIYVMDAASGESRRLTFHLADDAEPVWSPDGRYIAFTSQRDDLLNMGDLNLYLMDLTTFNMERLTPEGGRISRAAWSPDGRWLVFGYMSRMQIEAGASYKLMIIDLATREMDTLAEAGDIYSVLPSWSPDGERILYERMGPAGMTLHVYEVGRQLTYPLLPLNYVATTPTWGPSGRYVIVSAYPSDGSSRSRLYRVDLWREGMPFTPLTDIDTTASDPDWSPNGDLLAYVKDERIYARFGMGGRCTVMLLDLQTRVQRSLLTAREGICDNAPRWQP